jgi:hypothetical protein
MNAKFRLRLILAGAVLVPGMGGASTKTAGGPRSMLEGECVLISARGQRRG